MLIIQRKHTQNKVGTKHVFVHKLTILGECRSEVYSRMGMCAPPGGVSEAVPLTGYDVGLLSSVSTRFSSLRPTTGTFSESLPFFCGCRGIWNKWHIRANRPAEDLLGIYNLGFLKQNVCHMTNVYWIQAKGWCVRITENNPIDRGNRDPLKNFKIFCQNSRLHVIIQGFSKASY